MYSTRSANIKKRITEEDLSSSKKNMPPKRLHSNAKPSVYVFKKNPALLHQVKPKCSYQKYILVPPAETVHISTCGSGWEPQLMY